MLLFKLASFLLNISIHRNIFRKGGVNMRTFKCILKYGHAGSGKFVERSVYIKARTILDALYKAKHKKGVKKGNALKNGTSILAITEI